MKWWYKHFSDLLPNKGFGKEEPLFVEYFTGRVPLLLRDLLQFQGQPFNECLFLSSDGLQKVTHDVVEFYQKNKLGLHVRKCIRILSLLSVNT